MLAPFVMRFSCVLFDLDGTLIDQFHAIHRCHAYAMCQLGLPEPTLAQVRAAVGGGLDEAIARLAGADKVELLRPHFLHLWEKTNLHDVIVLPGAAEILQALRDRGIVCAVLTNKRGYAAREVCSHLCLTPMLRGIFGADDTPWIKPQPEFTAYALEQLGVNAADAVLIGDSPFDVATAINGGLGFVGVTTGTHNASELRAAGASRVAPDLAGVAAELGLTAAAVMPRS
jgi:phosphoglycolate phosphatase